MQVVDLPVALYTKSNRKEDGLAVIELSSSPLEGLVFQLMGEECCLTGM
jgi:hypothetical protein